MPIYKGNTKIVKLYKGSTQIIKRYKGTNLIYSASRLPAEFQEVEYLESTGTQYIDSGVQVSSLGTTGAMELVFKPATGFTNFCIFGSYKDANDNSFQAGYRNTDEITMSYGFNTALTYSVDKTIFNKLYLSNGVQKLNDVVIGNFATQSSITGNIYNLLLFGRTNGNGNNKYSATVKYVKIYDNNILIRNFVPCYRKADNVAGLYDLVNGVFYTNAGTGTFIVGGNV